ncbi:hypothetical protein BG000_009272 [Podila horticola]|nr:hypothetical protein BG000_009272 [Podila horticola]
MNVPTEGEKALAGKTNESKEQRFSAEERRRVMPNFPQQSIFLHIPINLSPDDSIGDLKNLLKTEKAPEFDDIAADKLTLWRVSIPITDGDELPILLDNVADKDKKKLRPVTRLSKVFPGDIPEEAINIIVQRPPTATSAELFPTVAVFKVTVKDRTPTTLQWIADTAPATLDELRDEIHAKHPSLQHMARQQIRL